MDSKKAAIKRRGWVTKKIANWLRPIEYRAVRWTVRRRSLRAYVALSTWPFLFVAVLTAWPYFLPPGKVHPALKHTLTTLQLLLVGVNWAFVHWQAKERWKRMG